MRRITMTRIQQFGSTVLIAVAFLPLVPCSGSAQQLTDAQAQSLIQSLAAQQSAGAANSLTAAQNQMLLQYLMSKQSAATVASGLTAAQSQAQTQMMLRQLTSAKPGLPGSGASSLLSPSAGGPANTPNATAVLGEKKAGIVRIGIAMPKSQLGQGAQGPAAGEPLRGMLAQYLAGPSVEIVSIAALLPEQIEAESKVKHCDYLVYSSIIQKKPTGGLGMLKSASSMANMIPMVGMMNGVSGAMAATSAATAASQAATMSSAVKAKSDIVLEYHVTATGNSSPVLSNSLKAKANADGEDVITPLVEQEASAIMTEVSKKK
jgi:hypothetical protein